MMMMLVMRTKSAMQKLCSLIYPLDPQKTWSGSAPFSSDSCNMTFRSRLHKMSLWKAFRAKLKSGTNAWPRVTPGEACMMPYWHLCRSFHPYYPQKLLAASLVSGFNPYGSYIIEASEGKQSCCSWQIADVCLKHSPFPLTPAPQGP